MKIKEYNQMMAYLTRPKDTLKDKFKKVKKEITVPGPLEQLTDKTEKEIMNDPNILRRIKYLSKTYDDIDLGKDFDKAIAQEDKQLAKLGRAPKNILQRNPNKTYREFAPKEATPEQVGKLAERLEKSRQMTGPFEKTLDKIKKPIKKKLPPVNLVEIPKYQPTDFKLPEPDPRTKALEENFNRIRKETEDEKRRLRTTGLAGLLPE
jgi:hypothetical protein